MSASKIDLPVEDPTALIRSRIKEKRIFEARFLYRQLGAEIGEKEEAALEKELSGILTQVKKLQHQAREYAAQGQNHLADRLYSDIEQIAIDVPGLAEEKIALAGAEALLARINRKVIERKPEAPPKKIEVAPMAAPPSWSDKLDLRLAPAIDRLKRLPRLWLLVGFFGLAIFLLLFFRGNHEEKSLSVPLKPSPTQPAQKASIKPLVPTPPILSDPPNKEAIEDESTTEAVSPPSPSLKVGELQVKESARD